MAAGIVSGGLGWGRRVPKVYTNGPDTCIRTPFPASNIPYSPQVGGCLSTFSCLNLDVESHQVFYKVACGL